MERSAGEGFKASGAALVGRYTYRPDSDAWTWSDTMFAIHGFEPRAVVPTTALVMRHIHPEDVAAAWESQEAAAERGETFSFLHRIRTSRGDLRVVLAAGHLEDEDGTPVVHGHLVDITDLRQDAVHNEVDSAVGDFVEHRAGIEQAKGVLMQIYSVDAETAWALLRAFSVDTNRKVRDIAHVLLEAATTDRTPTKRGLVSADEMLERLYADADVPGNGSASA